jgi:hypothetical protein
MRITRRSAARAVAILALGVAGFALAGLGAGIGLAGGTTDTGTTGTTTTPPPTTNPPPTTAPPPPPPEEGCTLTPGYWKTHAEVGSKKFDDTWLAVGGPDAAFFSSGQSYIEVLNADKSTGNAYYILAFQWIAAQLNQEAGASITGAAAAAFADGEALLSSYTPADIGALSGDDPLRQQFLAAAATLDDYNNGVIGPGHCGD